MKRVLFVISTLNTGGAQKVLSNLLMGLPDGYEADIVLNDAEDIVYPYRGNIINLKFPRQENKLNLWYQMKVLWKRVFCLYKLKTTGKYIAAISFLDSANIANILSGKKKCKTIISVHNNLSESAASKVYAFLVNPMVKMLYGRADKVIAVSKGIAYDLVDNMGLSGRNLITVYNGHAINTIRDMAEKEIPESLADCFNKRPVIATMGRMTYQKGQWHLIRAVLKIKEIFPEVRLLILGNGELQQYQEELAVQIGAEKNIIFCGFLENPFSILARCDIFVLPSMFEGFPNALIEALSCKVPCIATDFRSGAREILAPELPVEGQIEKRMYEASYGILTPVCDGKYYDGNTPLTEEELILAEAIISVLKDDELRVSYKRKAEEAVSELYVEKMVKKYLEIIEGK